MMVARAAKRLYTAAVEHDVRSCGCEDELLYCIGCASALHLLVVRQASSANQSGPVQMTAERDTMHANAQRVDNTRHT